MGYCNWSLVNEKMKKYHDEEWGIPVHEDTKQFEHLMMEVMQCGLNWNLVLQKRKIFRQCFDGFDFDRVAGYGEDDIQRILAVPGMIRSRRKIEAVIHNAGCFRKIREEFGSFSDYLWAYSEGRTILYHRHELGEVPASNGLSDIISKDLKKRGFKYLGSITVYSHLQASGIINDHSADCPCYQRIIDQYPTVRKRRTKER
ncbi:MAG: DNA-3-methyladenine glycosylase I [Selenomonadaceae bacterium]|nr:DNA-3-methyladenine glycosylase I [Selenomonadaceae bacterium]